MFANDRKQRLDWFWDLALFFPGMWKWYSYIDPNATELIAAIRAINMFFSLSLVFIFTAYWWKRPIITVRRFSRIVSWLRSKRHP